MWKQIPEYENYAVNEYGEVKNVNTNHIMATDINSAGYERIQVRKNGKSKKLFRHRLVAQNFLDNPNNYKEVNHIDGNKHNNHVSNLEWCDRTHNKRECRRKGLKEYKPFKVIYADGTQKEYEFTTELASKVGVTRRTIINWLQKRNHGYLNHEIIEIEYL